MDEQRLIRACEFRDQGRFEEASEELNHLAADTTDPVDKAGVLLNSVATYIAWGKLELAKRQLDSVQKLVFALKDQDDQRVRDLIINLGIAAADINAAEGDYEGASVKLGTLLEQHRPELQQPEFQGSYELIQTRRAFLLADIGRWREALPILQMADSFETQSRALISFYLGHSYVEASESLKGKEKLLEALGIGLPHYLAYRARHALGRAYHNLEAFEQAKIEFEKCVQTADPEYIRRGKLWNWLWSCCTQLGLQKEAAHYANLTRAS
jgi:tetratricopeptide (TPR) repeat protein